MGFDSQGFLSDPEDAFGRFENPEVRTIGQLSNRQFLVLCGEPASGKSTVVEEYVDQYNRDGKRLIFVNFREILSERGLRASIDESNEWASWIGSEEGLLLVIDGVDEGVIKIGNFLPMLVRIVRQLTSETRKRLRLFLVCRTLDWEKHLSRQDELAALFGLSNELKDRVMYTLCPLRAKDAELAANQLLLDGEAFLAAIGKGGLRSLAAYPFTLKMLLSEFHRGALASKTKRDFYEQYAAKLCSESHDPERRLVYGRDTVALPIERQILAAECLALIFIATGRSSIYTGEASSATDSDLTIDSLRSHLAQTPGGTLPTFSEIEAVLHSGIFTDRGSMRYGFLHQTMAECLAARVASKLDLLKIKQLFLQGHGNDRHVIPQLAQTASWLAESRNDVFEEILRFDAEALLRSDIRHISSSLKERVVEILLQKATAGQLSPHHKLYVAGLSHPNIAAQLRPVLIAKKDTPATTLAIDICEKCKLEELLPPLWELVQSDTIGVHIRDDAAGAICEIVNDSELETLQQLLSDEILKLDSSDNIRGMALRKLVPRQIAVRDALKYFTRSKRPNTLGVYEFFISRELPKHLTVADVPEAVNFLTNKRGWWKDRFEEFAEQTILLALRNLEIPAVESAFVAFWVKLHEEYILHHLGRGNDHVLSKLIEENVSVRKNLISRLLRYDVLWSKPDIKERLYRVYFDWDIRLVRTMDFTWLLAERDAANEILKSRISLVICQLLKFSFTELYTEYSERVLDFIHSDPEGSATFTSWLQPVKLSSPEAIEAREQYQEAERLRKRRINFDDRREWKDEVRLTLEACDNHPSWWAHLIGVLQFTPGWKQERSVENRSYWSGWDHLSPDQMQRALKAARAFAIGCEPGRFTPKKHSNFDEAAYAALRLNIDTVDNDPEFAEALSRKWTASIVSFAYEHGDIQSRIRQWIYHHAPLETRKVLRLITEHEARSSGIIVALQGFELCVDEDFFKMIWNLICTGRFRIKPLRYLVLFLAENTPIQLAKQIHNDLPQMTSNVKIAVFGVALRIIPNLVWDMLWELLRSKNHTAKQIIWNAAGIAEETERKYNFEGMGSQQLADIYLLSNELFPISADPPSTNGFQANYSRRKVVDFRSGIANALTNVGSPDACRQLIRLGDEIPEIRFGMLRRYHEARQNYRSSQWERPPSESVIAMLRTATTRLVRDADDLLDVVIESLDRLSKRISGTSNSRLLEYWDVGGTPQCPEFRGPRSEEFIAQQIAAWLQDDLSASKGCVINREVVPKLGQKTDIVVTAPAISGPEMQVPKVIIEIKGNWNPTIKTALKNQLVDRYLAAQQDAVGLYLVVWFGTEIVGPVQAKQNRMASKSVDDAWLEVARVASSYDGQQEPYLVKGFVLNCERTS